MSGETPVLACLGHWYASLLFAAPAALVAGALGVQTYRDRRAGTDDRELDLEPDALAPDRADEPREPALT